MWKILIVEDDPKDQNRLTQGLKAHAHLECLNDGEAAIKKFGDRLKAKAPYDFVLLDVTLPKKDGFEILKAIRMIEESAAPGKKPETRIIMITSFKDSLMENYNMGWDDFITKPVDTEILIKRMQAMRP